MDSSAHGGHFVATHGHADPPIKNPDLSLPRWWIINHLGYLTKQIHRHDIRPLHSESLGTGRRLSGSGVHSFPQGSGVQTAPGF